ncbi:unnamed protein product [Acanthosepion pharaonis]|uniref:Uncharacterized protein n=1 Tax=Acanthosepion pharaonis TaxID=158019 RepID=A0A812DI91_ACAPH|nr:unnamed protein product [Sepia pharaonis]
MALPHAQVHRPEHLHQRHPRPPLSGQHGNHALRQRRAEIVEVRGEAARSPRHRARAPAPCRAARYAPTGAVSPISSSAVGRSASAINSRASPRHRSRPSRHGGTSAGRRASLPLQCGAIALDHDMAVVDVTGGATRADPIVARLGQQRHSSLVTRLSKSVSIQHNRARSRSAPARRRGCRDRAGNDARIGAICARQHPSIDGAARDMPPQEGQPSSPLRASRTTRSRSCSLNPFCNPSSKAMKNGSPWIALSCSSVSMKPIVPIRPLRSVRPDRVGDIAYAPPPPRPRGPRHGADREPEMPGERMDVHLPVIAVRRVSHKRPC